jgi:electron transfer flavoprotein alpha subunit
MNKRILIIAEHSNDKIMPLTLELLACAGEIIKNVPAKIEVAVLGKDIRKQAAFLAETTGVDTIALINDDLRKYSAEGYILAISELVGQVKPDLIIIPHSPRGYDYAPQVAVKLKAACITGVSGIDFAGGQIFYRRQGFYGKMEITMESRSFCTVITILPGAFKYSVKKKAARGVVTTRETITTLLSTKAVNIKTSAEQQTSLNDAAIIIAAGKGIEKIENIKLLQDMAALFPQSAIGGSRAACDQGWLAPGSQIGLTGKTVSPKLYIACGISGAMQHIAGMKESQTIIAINRDPHAAIFQYADFGVIDDFNAFITAFIKEFSKKRV